MQGKVIHVDPLMGMRSGWGVRFWSALSAVAMTAAENYL